MKKKRNNNDEEERRDYNRYLYAHVAVEARAQNVLD